MRAYISDKINFHMRPGFLSEPAGNWRITKG